MKKIIHTRIVELVIELLKATQRGKQSSVSEIKKNIRLNMQMLSISVSEAEILLTKILSFEFIKGEDNAVLQSRLNDHVYQSMQFIYNK